MGMGMLRRIIREGDGEGWGRGWLAETLHTGMLSSFLPFIPPHHTTSQATTHTCHWDACHHHVPPPPPPCPTRSGSSASWNKNQILPNPELEGQAIYPVFQSSGFMHWSRVSSRCLSITSTERERERERQVRQRRGHVLSPSCLLY